MTKPYLDMDLITLQRRFGADASIAASGPDKALTACCGPAQMQPQSPMQS